MKLCPSCQHPAVDHDGEDTNRYRRSCCRTGCGCGITYEEIKGLPEGCDSPPTKELRPLNPKEVSALRTALGARCGAARYKLGLSQRELAKIMGKSHSWVREVESGSQFAPWWLVVALSESTGFSVSWFCGFGCQGGAEVEVK